MSVALVTGASRGIGRSIAFQLAQNGFVVAVNYVANEQAALQLCEEIRCAGGKAVPYRCDVSDSTVVGEMCRRICKELGEITVLVNNAGVSQQKLFTEITDEDWHRMMRIHVDGAFFASRAVLPDMIRSHHGCIINVSSMWGQVGGSCEVHYSAAKAAIIGLTKALAKEVGPAGIRVNCVAPGVIRTDMLEHLDESALAALSEETPLCRLGTPEDVAQVVSFLVSEKAAFITGQVLAPNGGIVI